MAMQDTMSAWFCTMNSWLSTGGFLLLFLRIAMAGRELGAAAASPLPAQLSPRPGRGGGGGGGRAAEEWQPPLRFTPPRPRGAAPAAASSAPAGRRAPPARPRGGEGVRSAVQTDQRRRDRRPGGRHGWRSGPGPAGRAEPCRAAPPRAVLVPARQRRPPTRRR